MKCLILYGFNMVFWFLGVKTHMFWGCLQGNSQWIWAS